MRCRQVTRMISESHERSLDIQEKVAHIAAVFNEIVRH